MRLHLSYQAAPQCTARSYLTAVFPFDLPAGMRVKSARHIGAKRQPYAGCRNVADIRHPLAEIGHFDRLGILGLSP